MFAFLGRLLSFMVAKLLLWGRKLSYEFGQTFELDSLGINYSEPTTKVRQIEAWYNEYGYAGIRIIGDASNITTSVFIRFDSKLMVSDFGVEYWYEHSLDAMLGPYWHHAGGGAGGDHIFNGLTNDILAKSHETLSNLLQDAEQMQGVSYLMRKIYLERTLRILSFLMSEKGKAFREMSSGVRESREHRCGYKTIYAALSTL